MFFNLVKLFLLINYLEALLKYIIVVKLNEKIHRECIVNIQQKKRQEA